MVMEGEVLISKSRENVPACTGTPSGQIAGFLTDCQLKLLPGFGAVPRHHFIVVGQLSSQASRQAPCSRVCASLICCSLWEEASVANKHFAPSVYISERPARNGVGTGRKKPAE